MYTIPKITQEIKASVYETTIYTAKLLWNNIELERADKLDPKGVEEYFININAFDPNLYSDEKLTTLREQYVPGLRNIFSVDISKEKILYDIQELTTKLISKLRYTVTLLDNDFKNLISKKKQINTLIDKTKKDVLPFIDANQFFNVDFQSKEALLASCQKSLTTAYAGKLFLSHSVEDLFKIIWNITNNLFVLEESRTGRDLSKKYDLEGCSNAVKYFISKDKIKNFKESEILKFNVSDFIKDLNNLPKQLKSDSDSIVDFIISLHQPDPNKQPDSPATTAEMFNEILKSVMMCWARAAGIYDSDLRMMIEETSAYNIDPIADIVNEIEECYRKIINKDEIGQIELDKELTSLKSFIELLNAGISCTYYSLQCKVYDIIRYLINFDFFLFIKNLVLMLYLNFRNENKDATPNTGNATPDNTQGQETQVQNQTPPEGSNETAKPEGSNPEPDSNTGTQDNQNQPQDGNK